MTESEKTDIVANAKPVHMLVSKLGLKNTDPVKRNKILAKYKCFVYKNYDGGFRSSTVYRCDDEYYCNLYHPPANSRPPQRSFRR